jgi:hypothetical protein
MSIGSDPIMVDLALINTLIYTVPQKRKYRAVCFLFVNRNAVATPNIFLYRVPSGDSPGNNNVIIPGTLGWRLPAGGKLEYKTFKVFPEHYEIWAYTDSANVTLHIDGDLVDIDK